ncbi:MAG: hypothetical protein NXH75_10075, partial [Halobacteriovoraceae bacterium]|nr:hypothetical protein [Halobacteriovoraceae bacterium]
MKRSWWYRFTFLILISVICGMMIVPTALNFSEETNFPVKSKITLGLDLQGGLYMVLGIDFNKVYADEIKGYARKIAYVLNDKGIKARSGTPDSAEITDPMHSVVIEDVANVGQAEEEIKKFFPSVIRLTREEGAT